MGTPRFSQFFNGNSHRDSLASNPIREHLVTTPDKSNHGFANSVSLFLQRFLSGSMSQSLHFFFLKSFGFLICAAYVGVFFLSYFFLDMCRYNRWRITDWGRREGLLLVICIGKVGQGFGVWVCSINWKGSVVINFFVLFCCFGIEIGLASKFFWGYLILIEALNTCLMKCLKEYR